MPQITVNGRVVEAKQGETILSALDREGIRVPTLCHVKGLEPRGACRVCLVEVEGFRGLVPSCSYPVSDGMKIHTHSERALEARRTIVELLLADHPDDCLYCQKSYDCELRSLAESLGIHQRRFRNTSEPHKLDLSNSFIVRDEAKCILCGRCVAVCNSVVVNEVLNFGNRGAKAKIICDTDVPMGLSTCVMCGACVQACPVGALTEKKAMTKGRSNETRVVRTTCPYCGVGCQLNVQLNGEDLVRVTGVENAEPNRGSLCVKGRFGYDFPYAKDRLTTPLIRENGELRPASWDEALDLVASKLKQIIAESGPKAIGGVSCARSTNEDNYSMQKLFRAVLKSPNLDHCART
jgi:formate dehydrogenase major subunit